MTTTPVQQPGPITGTVLFYSKPEPLAPELHGKLGVKQSDRPFRFAKEGHAVPLTVGEFPLAAVTGPIIFVGDEKTPIAVMGLNAGENMFVSDDGQFVHAYTSPKRKVPKLYLATTRHPLDDAQLAALREGVLLHGEAKPIAAVAAQARSDRELELTVLEGKYHQVKRMVAAAGNRVEALHRERIGGLVLPAALAEGAWQWLDAADLGALRNG